jgi:hypothetical protein
MGRFDVMRTWEKTKELRKSYDHPGLSLGPIIGCNIKRQRRSKTEEDELVPVTESEPPPGSQQTAGWIF